MAKDADKGEQELLPCPWCLRVPQTYRRPVHYDSRYGKDPCKTERVIRCITFDCPLNSFEMKPEKWAARSTTSDYQRGVSDALKAVEVRRDKYRGVNEVSNHEAEQCCAAIRALLTNEQQEVQGWQPIATAPMRTPILIYNANWGRPVREERLRDGADKWVTGMYPTHWMPLPAPPVTEAAPVHACGDPDCIVPHPAPHKRPPG